MWRIDKSEELINVKNQKMNVKIRNCEEWIKITKNLQLEPLLGTCTGAGLLQSDFGQFIIRIF